MLDQIQTEQLQSPDSVFCGHCSGQLDQKGEDLYCVNCHLSYELTFKGFREVRQQMNYILRICLAAQVGDSSIGSKLHLEIDVGAFARGALRDRSAHDIYA